MNAALFQTCLQAPGQAWAQHQFCSRPGIQNFVVSNDMGILSLLTIMRDNPYSQTGLPVRSYHTMSCARWQCCGSAICIWALSLNSTREGTDETLCSYRHW
jgi:hypothetical protein